MIPDRASTTFGLDPFKPHWDLYPKTYVASKISAPLIDDLDGDLTKPVWNAVPWSEYFDDIRGIEDAPPGDRPNSKCKTRFKAVWDEQHLYIGALIETDFETVALFKERNSPIYQKDSDFEVFIDPIGSCHNYKELELNAINTVWNLLLDKPYNDGGHEHSGRVAKPGEELYYEVYGQKTAVKLLQGELNKPGSGTVWSLEIAISYKDVMAHIAETPSPISTGDMWRINFSRVERKGATNWTWYEALIPSFEILCFAPHAGLSTLIGSLRLSGILYTVETPVSCKCTCLIHGAMLSLEIKAWTVLLRRTHLGRSVLQR